jgi:hypothetical protein
MFWGCRLKNKYQQQIRLTVTMPVPIIRDPRRKPSAQRLQLWAFHCYPAAIEN